MLVPIEAFLFLIVDVVYISACKHGKNFHSVAPLRPH